MHINKELDYKVIFKLICACLAVSTTIWCCYEFGKNEDMCEVSYKRFLQDAQSIYPDVTVIIPYQLNEEQFENMSSNQHHLKLNEFRHFDRHLTHHTQL